MKIKRREKEPLKADLRAQIHCSLMAKALGFEESNLLGLDELGKMFLRVNTVEKSTAKS